MASIVIGCPVSGRAWILDKWFSHQIEACNNADLVPEFVFVVPKEDTADQEVIKQCCGDVKKGGFKVDIIETEEPPRPPRRTWSASRYQHMVILRNTLLRRVRQIGPTYFWSIDSDILAAPDALMYAKAVIDTRDCSAVGMHLYLSMVGRFHSSRAEIVNNHLCNRQVHESMFEGTYPTDAVMASVLMGPKAYNVDYQFHDEGEDVGYSVAAREAGLHFLWCGKALCKHCMEPDALNKFDNRVGF